MFSSPYVYCNAEAISSSGIYSIVGLFLLLLRLPWFFFQCHKIFFGIKFYADHSDTDTLVQFKKSTVSIINLCCAVVVTYIIIVVVVVIIIIIVCSHKNNFNKTDCLTDWLTENKKTNSESHSNQMHKQTNSNSRYCVWSQFKLLLQVGNKNNSIKREKKNKNTTTTIIQV